MLFHSILTKESIYHIKHNVHTSFYFSMEVYWPNIWCLWKYMNKFYTVFLLCGQTYANSRLILKVIYWFLVSNFTVCWVEGVRRGSVSSITTQVCLRMEQACKLTNKLITLILFCFVFIKKQILWLCKVMLCFWPPFICFYFISYIVAVLVFSFFSRVVVPLTVDEVSAYCWVFKKLFLHFLFDPTFCEILVAFFVCFFVQHFILTKWCICFKVATL